MKCINRIERYKTIGILQGLIAQNEIKENPSRIPLADMHIEALKIAVSYIEEYEEIMALAYEIAEHSHQKAMAIENKLTYISESSD